MGWDEIQQQVRGFDEKFRWDNDTPQQTIIHAIEELGETAKTLLNDGEYRRKQFSKNDLSEEIVDTLYLLVKLANHYEIDLGNEWDRIPSRYHKKSNE